MKVLVLDEWIPYPLISGKRLRSYHLLTRAAHGHDMTCLCFADSVAEHDSLKHMESLGIKMVTLPRKDPFNPPYKLYAWAAANVVSPLPLVMRKHFRRDYLAKLRSLLSDEKFDLIHCEWTHYGAYARLVQGIPLFLSSHNIEAMPWERLFRHEINPVKRAALYLEWKKMAAFERSVCQSFHHISAVSEDDRRKFIEDYGCKSVTIIPNGVDVAFYRDFAIDASRHESPAVEPIAAAVARTLVFSASFDAFVNQDAVVYWMESIWPKVLKELPEVGMLFLGKDPTPGLIRYASEKVQFTGTVPDVRPYLAKSSVCVVPLRVAGGSRIKILEAMAAGIPVVSTPEGAEGLDVVPGEHLLVARNADEFVRQVSRALQDEGMVRYLTANARRLVEDRYDWKNIAPLTPAAWQETVRRFEEKRTGIGQGPKTGITGQGTRTAR